MSVQRESLEDALRQLWVLGALDPDGGITPLGRAMVALPLDPALARALLAAADLGCVPDMLTVAAMLSAESIFMGNRFASAVIPAAAAAAIAEVDSYGCPIRILGQSHGPGCDECFSMLRE